MSILSCINNQQNLGRSDCKKLPQLPKGIITTPENFSLSFDDAATLSNWQDAILAAKGARIYYWPNASSFEDNSEDSVYEETALDTYAVRDGNYRFRFFFRENLQLHKAIKSHRGFDGRIFIIDNENKIIGTTLPNGNFAGFKIGLLNPEKMKFNDGSAGSKSPVYISLEDNLELDDSGAQIDGTFLKSLTRLTTVDLTVIGSPSASEIVVSVLSNLDLVPVLGLVAADFTFSGGGTINTVTDNDDGTYTIAGTTLTSGDLNLVDAASLNVPGFESSGAVAVTI